MVARAGKKSKHPVKTMSVIRDIGAHEPQAFGLAASYILDPDGSVRRAIRLGARRPGHPNATLYLREPDGAVRDGRWEVPLDDPRSAYANQVLLPAAEAFLVLAARLSSFVMRQPVAGPLHLGGLRLELELDQWAAPAAIRTTHLGCSVLEEVSDPDSPRRGLARLSLETETIERRVFPRPLQAELFDAEGRVREVVEDEADWHELRMILADRLEPDLSGLLDDLDQAVEA